MSISERINPLLPTLWKQTVEKYGIDKQVDMVIEECAELIAAIHHYRRGKIPLKELCEELADVLIMVSCFADDNVAFVDDAIDFKIGRMFARMGNKGKTLSA